MLLPLAATLSTMTYTGDVPAAGGDYADVAFAVPAGTKEIRIAHSDGSEGEILDWGVWSPDGFRGWGGGLTDDAVIGVAQSSRGYVAGPIAAGMWTLVIGKALIDPSGAHYTVTVTCNDTASLPVKPQAAYAPIVRNAARGWYRGDFHVHSEESGDADATFDQITALAAARGLDFVNLSDHNTVSQHALAAAYNASHTGPLLLRGAEITTYAGHGNAVGISAYVDHRIGYRGRAITGVLADVAAQGGIFIVNHPKLDLGMACIGCAWNHPDTDWSRVAGLELITGNWDTSINTFVPQVLPMWDALLDRGYRIAAIGGSDDHTAGRSTGPTASSVGSPTTLVLADNLSEAAIIAAIQHGRTIVQLRGPMDPVVDVHLRRADASAAELGDDVDGITSAELTVAITGGAGTIAQLWRDGEKLDGQQPVTADPATLTFRDPAPPGNHRYRVEVVNSLGSRLVVTSHIYATIVAPPAEPSDDGGGCGATRSLGLAPLLALLALRRRRT
jgi:hypothetical protein